MGVITIAANPIAQDGESRVDSSLELTLGSLDWLGRRGVPDLREFLNSRMGHDDFPIDECAFLRGPTVPHAPLTPKILQELEKAAEQAGANARATPTDGHLGKTPMSELVEHHVTK